MDTEELRRNLESIHTRTFCGRESSMNDEPPEDSQSVLRLNSRLEGVYYPIDGGLDLKKIISSPCRIENYEIYKKDIILTLVIGDTRYRINFENESSFVVGLMTGLRVKYLNEIINKEVVSIFHPEENKIQGIYLPK